MANDDDTLIELQSGVLQALAEALPEEAPPAGVRAKLQAQLHGALRFAPFEAEVVEAFGVDAAALREALTKLDDRQAWQPGPWPDSRIFLSVGLAQACSVLAMLAPGTQIDAHGHSARELTYVLSGELTEQGQRTYAAGDLMTAEPGHAHALYVASDAPCLVVFSVRPPAAS